MLCPVCAVELQMTDRQGIEIDYCPQCRGVWLDRGELDKIIERGGAIAAGPAAGPGASPSVAPPPPPPRDAYREPPRDAYREPPRERRYRDDDDDDYYKKKRRKNWLEELFD